MYSTKIKFLFENALKASIAFKAVKPEIMQAKFTRSNAKIQRKSNTIILEIQAKDLNAFKASINSFAKSILLSKKIMDIEVKK
jgi:tRNA threonylcarbamoyladenosine modification (KEOPS) complex  Pcc1 subunit